MTTLSLAEARANLSKLVESAVSTHERFEVTRNGDRVAVLLGADDYDSLLELWTSSATPTRSRPSGTGSPSSRPTRSSPPTRFAPP